MNDAVGDSLRIACPDCRALNRVPAARLGDRPVCGRCKAPLFARQPVPLDADAFDRHVMQADLPVLIDFWAPWCQPCLMMAPEFHSAAAALEPAFRLAKVDTQAQPELGAQYGIRSIPTLVLFRAGRELARRSGAIRSNDIVQWARAQLR